MKWRYAGRFAVERDPAAFVAGQHLTHKRIWLRDEVVPEDALWLAGVDIETGERVSIDPRGPVHAWHLEVEREALARAVMALRCPFVAPVRHVGPGIAYAALPPAYPRPRLSAADAAACAVQACEVVAHLHALGKTRMCFGPSNLRLTNGDGAWRIVWLVPFRGELESLDHAIARSCRPKADARSRRARADEPEPPPIVAAQRQVIAFFTDLLDAGKTTAEQRAAIAELDRIARGEASCSDMTALARRFLPLVTEPAVWTARIDALPAARIEPPPGRDWDAIIGDGEATLSTVSGRYHRHVAQPLAVAYHQRACRSLAAGAIEAAHVDLKRAAQIDPYVEHHTSLAVVLDRMGQREAARAALAKGIALARRGGPVRDKDGTIIGAGEFIRPEDLARGLEVTALFALHDGDPAAAESALREAWTLAPSASRAHALGAALYLRGDVAGAAELEREAVARAPDNTRYRWDLAVSLVRLGRATEAKPHAEAALRDAPDDSPLRERFTRLFRADVTEPERE